MSLEVVWSGRGALPYPPGRSEDDDIRYQQRVPEERPAERHAARAERRQLAVYTSKKCEQCWHRMIPAGEARKGHARCRVCRKAKPRRGGPLPKAEAL